MNKVLVILGPTSTGKTDLALLLAKKFNGELVACDSRQVYKGLDIGTGKMPSGKWKVEDGRWKKGKGWWEIDGTKIWMYDVVNTRKQYTVYDYVKDAGMVVEDIRKRGKLPIIVGGTGLYLKALLEGLPNLTIKMNPKLRKKLSKLSLQQLQERLKEISPKKWGSMNSSDRQNPRRLVRAIEIVLTDFTSEESLRASWVSNGDQFALRAEPIRGSLETLKIGLTAPREILYQRIDERVTERVNQDMIEEAKKLHRADLTFRRMRQFGLEYGILADYLEGKIPDQKELIKVLQGKIHGYARRQITWFKKEKGVSWFDITASKFSIKVENLVAKWYYLADDTEN